MGIVNDYFSFQNGYAFKSVDFTENGEYKIIKIKELKDGSVKFFDDTAEINPSCDFDIEKYIIRKGDVLFALTGDPVSKPNPLSWVGRVSYYTHDEPALLNQRVCKAVPKGSVPNEYLYYFFRQESESFKLASKATGSASQANISTKTIEQHRMDIPDKDKMDKIVSVLRNIDEKIENNNQINRNLSEQAMALYKKMTIDASEECIEGVLSDVAEIVMGQSPKGDTYNEDGDGTVFYQGRAEFGDRFPTRRLFTSAPKRLAKEHTVLISVRAPVGDVNVAYEECCIGRGLCSVGSKDNHQSFVLYTMYSLKDQFDIYNGEGTVFGSINKDSMNGMSIQIPNKALMDKFEEIVSPMDAVIKANYEENCRLIAMRDNLLCKLMSGELDVSGVNI